VIRSEPHELKSRVESTKRTPRKRGWRLENDGDKGGGKGHQDKVNVILGVKEKKGGLGGGRRTNESGNAGPYRKRRLFEIEA